MIEGLQLAYQDDDALLAQGMTLFDSLYRSFEQSDRSAGPRPGPSRNRSASQARKTARSKSAGERARRRGPVRRAIDDVAAWAQPAAARAALVRLCAAGFVAYCSYSICRAPLLPLFARELGAGSIAHWLVMGASTLTGVFLKLPAGALSDLFGRRRLLLAGALVFATCLLRICRVDVRLLVRCVPSWQRYGHLWPRRVRKPLRYRAGRRARHVAQHLLDRAGHGPGIGPVLAGYLIAAGRFDLGFIISGVIGLGVRSSSLLARPPAGTPQRLHGAVQAGRRRGRKRSTGADHERRPCGAVRAERHAQRLSAALRPGGPEPLGIRVGWLFGMQTVTTLLVRPAIGLLSDRIGRRAVIAPG